MPGEFSQQPFDNTAREARWEGWTPPWMEQEGRGPGTGHGPGGRRHGWEQRGWHGPFGFFFGQGRPWSRWGIPDELLALRTEAAEVARLFAIASRGAFGNRERLSQLRAFLERAHKELAEMIYNAPPEQTGTAGEAPGNSSDIGQA